MNECQHNQLRRLLEGDGRTYYCVADACGAQFTVAPLEIKIQEGLTAGEGKGSDAGS